MANLALSCPICGGKVERKVTNQKWLLGCYRCLDCEKQFGFSDCPLEDAMNEFLQECEKNDFQGINEEI